MKILMFGRGVIWVLAARSVDLKSQRGTLAAFRLPAWVIGTLMGLAPKLLRPVRVMLDSHSNVAELRGTCRDVLAEARRLGVGVPRLEGAASLFFEMG
jgi:2-dehydropantoate 2-reductase